MKTLKIDVSLLIADAIIDAVEYNPDAILSDGLKLHSYGDFFEFDVKLTNASCEKVDVYRGDKVIDYYYELTDFDFELITDSIKLFNKRKDDTSTLTNYILTFDSDTVKTIVFNAI